MLVRSSGAETSTNSEEASATRQTAVASSSEALPLGQTPGQSARHGRPLRPRDQWRQPPGGPFFLFPALQSYPLRGPTGIALSPGAPGSGDKDLQACVLSARGGAPATPLEVKGLNALYTWQCVGRAAGVIFRACLHRLGHVQLRGRRRRRLRLRGHELGVCLRVQLRRQRLLCASHCAEGACVERGRLQRSDFSWDALWQAHAPAL